MKIDADAPAQTQILLDAPTALIRRAHVRSGRFSLLQEMRVERGLIADWAELAELHYKSRGHVVGRTYRCLLGDSLIAVAIIGSPRLLLKGRHLLFPKLAPQGDTKIVNTYRAKFVNQNFVLLSRIVVDTVFRASGVSYRMANLIARMDNRPYVEIQSSMSKFNPFAIKAGFRFVKPRESSHFATGLSLMKNHFTAHPGDYQMIMAELEAMPPARATRVMQAMRAFYYRFSALERTGNNIKLDVWTRVLGYTDAFIIKNIQQLVFGSAMYGIYRNPDLGRVLPATLPLIAFDRQAPDAPLEI
jgi:ABC-type ATPase with predicted acetyltransferase domain